MSMTDIYMNQILSKRKRYCDESFAEVQSMIDELEHNGITPVKIIAGGTPSFPVHALRKGVDLSPGTILLMGFWIQQLLRRYGFFTCCSITYT